MKKLLSLLLVLISSASVAKAEDDRLRPLSEILNEEQSEVMLAYATQRCAALFAVVVERTSRNPSASNELIETWKQASDFLIQMSTLFVMNQRSVTAEEAGEVALETIFEISKLYDKEMEDYYLRTGNSFDEQIQDDILTCTEIHSSLKEGLGETSE